MQEGKTIVLTVRCPGLFNSVKQTAFVKCTPGNKIVLHICL